MAAMADGEERPGQVAMARAVAEAIAGTLRALGAEEVEAASGPRPRPYLYRPGFSGREQPLHELRRELERLQRGLGGLVLIAGESGVGKTRLVLELAREAAAKPAPAAKAAQPPAETPSTGSPESKE